MFNLGSSAIDLGSATAGAAWTGIWTTLETLFGLHP